MVLWIEKEIDRAKMIVISHVVVAVTCQKGSAFERMPRVFKSLFTSSYHCRWKAVG